MDISTSALSIFMLASVLLTFIVVPLVASTLLWLTGKLWHVKDVTFKSSFKVIVIILPVMFLVLGVAHVLFYSELTFGQLAVSSPQTFLLVLLTTTVIGVIVGALAIKKIFEESFAKSIGVIASFFALCVALFFVFIVTVTSVLRPSPSSVAPASAVSGVVAEQTSSNSDVAPIVVDTNTAKGTTHKQTIQTKETTLQTVGKGIFSVVKYPREAVSWTVRIDVPIGVSAKLVAITLNGKSPVGPIIDGNQDIVLGRGDYAAYQEVALFEMRITNKTKTDQVVNIISKTLDSSGALLNQSTLPITIKINSDSMIKDLITKIIPQSDQFQYTHQQGGFTGFCASPDPATVGGILSIVNELKSLSGSVVCKDSQTAFAISAQLKSDPNKYFCVDSPTTVVTRTSPVITTSCK
jgi:hypothetical protein